MNPTEEQIREFWKRCGVKPTKLKTGVNYHGTPIPYTATLYPPIDLNNLFKYAVPKLSNEATFDRVEISLPTGKMEFWVKLVARHQSVVEKDKDPALALFWAIYKVIEDATK